ncbi:MAG: sensor histidine kinase [Opitutales bacterium]
MSIKLRFTLTLGGLLLAFAAMLLVLQGLKARELARARMARQAGESAELDHWLNADTAELLRMARALAADDSIRARLQGLPLPTHTTEPDASDAGLTLWVFDRDGHLAWHTRGATIPSRESLVENETTRRNLFVAQERHFNFVESNRIFECALVPIVGPDSPRPIGWLWLNRVWDLGRLDHLGAMVGAHCTLAPVGAKVPATVGVFQLLRELTDWQHRPVQLLIVGVAQLDDSQLQPTGIPATPWFIGFGLLVVAGVALALQRWVLRPLGRITASLSAENPAPLQPLRDEPDELGEVARRLENSYQQRQALRLNEASLLQALDGRIKLGRDLHDSVIQSLYATGMGLSGIKLKLQPDQAELAASLEQSRTSLNETIRDLRNFITGLEPEVLTQKTFSQAVADLMTHMQSVASFQSRCTIDDGFAQRLTLSQRANLLQITREAVSNALRHGAASEVTVALHARDERIMFEICDNGVGFDAQAGTNGHGLDNLSGRAQDLGAHLEVQSQPGHGTHLQLAFEIPPKAIP